MAKNALRELSRHLPSRPEIKKIMDGLIGEDDLHVAIIGVSIVEAHLEQLIVSRLHRADKEFTNLLFEQRGPLSDLNSKILIGEAFGFLTGPLAKELHVFRAIRNSFAHAKMPLSFDLEPVKNEVRKLKLAIGGGAKIADPAIKALSAKIAPRSAFLLAIRLTLIILDEVRKKKSPADKVLARALKVKPTGK